MFISAQLYISPNSDVFNVKDVKGFSHYVDTLHDFPLFRSHGCNSFLMH